MPLLTMKVKPVQLNLQQLPMLAPTCSFQALEPLEGAGTCAETKPAGKDTVVVDTVTVLNLGEDEHINVLTKPPRDWLKTNFIFDTS